MCFLAKFDPCQFAVFGHRNLVFLWCTHCVSNAWLLMVMRNFKGNNYFPKVNPKESLFIGGASDRVLGYKHRRLLKKLVPAAPHFELPGIGHMIHLEAHRFLQNT